MGGMSHLGPRVDGPLRVLVVDADDRVRESLTGLLAISGQCMVVASAGQVSLALDLALDQWGLLDKTFDPRRSRDDVLARDPGSFS